MRLTDTRQASNPPTRGWWLGKARAVPARLRPRARKDPRRPGTGPASPAPSRGSSSANGRSRPRRKEGSAPRPTSPDRGAGRRRRSGCASGPRWRASGGTRRTGPGRDTVVGHRRPDAASSAVTCRPSPGTPRAGRPRRTGALGGAQARDRRPPRSKRRGRPASSRQPGRRLGYRRPAPREPLRVGGRGTGRHLGGLNLVWHRRTAARARWRTRQPGQRRARAGPGLPAGGNRPPRMGPIALASAGLGHTDAARQVAPDIMRQCVERHLTRVHRS